MQWRYYTPADHEMIAEWWNGWKWRVIPPASLPVIGAIAYNIEKPLAAAWLYRSDSCVAMIGFFITNPDSSARQRNAALKTVVKALTDTAFEAGYTTVFATVIKEGLAKLIESQGFNYREENSINLFKVLDNGC